MDTLKTLVDRIHREARENRAMMDSLSARTVRAIRDGDQNAINSVARDAAGYLDEQMAQETESTGTVGGSDRDQSGGATSGDVPTESGSGEPSSATETLEE